MRSNHLAAALGAALLAGGVLPLDVALAQGKRPAAGKAAAPAAPAVDVKALEAKIRSGEAAQVIEALGAAREAGAAAAAVAPAAEELLRGGATVAVATAAIEALGALGQASSGAAIRPYVKHRVQELRREAVKALVHTKGAEAVAAFRDGLRSNDGVVRGFSATGLGSLGASEALPDLFAALDRDVTEAAASIGQLCDPAACKALLERLGKVAFDVMTSGLDPILFRAQPLPEALLVEIVGQLRELGTPEAGKYLADVASRWPATGSQKVKQVLDSAVASIPGALP